MIFVLALLSVAQDVQAELVTAISEWTACRAAHLVEHAGDVGTPEAVADAGMAACAEEERRATEVARRHGFGPGLMARVRAGFREQLVSAVADERAGRPPTDPSQAWGWCVGEAAIARAQRADGASADAMIDAAMETCRDAEARVLRVVVAEDGEQGAAESMARLRAIMRQHLLARLADGSLLAGHPPR